MWALDRLGHNGATIMEAEPPVAWVKNVTYMLQ